MECKIKGKQFKCDIPYEKAVAIKMSDGSLIMRESFDDFSMVRRFQCSLGEITIEPVDYPESYQELETEIRSQWYFQDEEPHMVSAFDNYNDVFKYLNSFNWK